MAVLELVPIARVVIGLVLVFVAARIVGFVIKVVGGAFIAYGAYLYIQAGQHVTIDVVFPAIVGIALIAVGKSMAETAIKVVGALVVLWGIVGLGII